MPTLSTSVCQRGRAHRGAPLAACSAMDAVGAVGRSPPTLTVPAWMARRRRSSASSRRTANGSRASGRSSGRGSGSIRATCRRRMRGRASRELVAMLVEEEAPELGVEADARSRSATSARAGARARRAARCRSTGGSCSRPSTCSTTSSCTSSAICASRTTRAASGSSSRQRRPDWRAQRDWLHEHGPELLAFRPRRVEYASSAVEPVLARRREDVDVERVLERFRLCAARAAGSCSTSPAPTSTTSRLVVAEPEAKRPLEDVA